MNMYTCNRCSRSFASKRGLDYHGLKKTPCIRPEHYCGTCNRGFSSARTLWYHTKICKAAKSLKETSIRENGSEISGNDDVPVIPRYEKLSDIPGYVDDSKMERHISRQSTHDSIESSDGFTSTTCNFAEDEESKEINGLFIMLDSLGKMICAGYRHLKHAIIDTIDALQRHDTITEVEYQALTSAVYRRFDSEGKE